MLVASTNSGSADERISAIAKVFPHRTALIDADHCVSFSELEIQTESFAAGLGHHGIGRGDAVGVLFDSRIEIIPTLRAILRVGAIFVPIDPDHPKDRVDFILNDTDARALITTDALAEKVCLKARTTLTIESLPRSSRFLPREVVSLEDPACILYTSGSTGPPKGVLRLHRGIVSRLDWSSSESDDIFCHNMPLCYGFSQERIFLPLMLGAPLVMLPDVCHKDPVRFSEEVYKHGVTQITVVPAFLEQLISPPKQLSRSLRAVRNVTVGSALLGQDTVDLFHSALPNARLINVYGSTECGTLTRGQMMSRDCPNAGFPVPNTNVFILDEQFQPVPVGEVYGGGPSLAAGYWRRPELTAERFLPNPFGYGTSVLYRTGDHARRLPDGRIQLIGRLDRQVKIRGHRIELQEVEAAMQKCPEVAEAAIVTQPIGSDNRLIAYVCPQQDEVLSVTTLRKQLRDFLPDYMLPSAYVFLPVLPRTPLGKLDSMSLPSLGSTRPDLGTPYVAPANSLENSIADAWAEILEKDCVGRNDHFLDLGGDSLRAVELATVLEDRIGLRIDVMSIFEVPTVAEMAAWMELRTRARGIL